MIISSKRVIKSIILASLIWFMIVIVFIFFNFNFDLNEKLVFNSYKAKRYRGTDEDAWTYEQYELKSWSPAPTLVWNTNHFGENGSEVTVPENKTAEADEMFKINYFNLVASDMIPLNRSLLDYREPECKSRKYQDFLPTTSVVIIFREEAWSTLLRTVWSIINRSPKELLAEIILVDDASEQDHLKVKLEKYLTSLPIPIYLYRLQARKGLIKARLVGAKNAKGQVLVFLDAHCECTEGWLEPLLSRIAQNRKAVVVPIIDSISDKNFKYSKKNYKKGIFDPSFEFTWSEFTKEEKEEFEADKTRPFPTPVIAGGLLAIDREYFFESGSYDEGMNIWGGENIEMSIRIWLCGGSLETAACSRVGHVYRDNFPYSFPDGIDKTVDINLSRVYEVWLDGWKHFARALYPKAYLPAGDVRDRENLRKRLKCNSFRWYLENIFPESDLFKNPLYLTSIKNVKTKKCIDVRSSGKQKISLQRCYLGLKQRFIFSQSGEIKIHMKCIDGVKPNATLQLFKCHNLQGNQEWWYNKKDKTIRHVPTRYCIEVIETDDNSEEPALRRCNPRDPAQRWFVKNDFNWKKYLK